MKRLCFYAAVLTMLSCGVAWSAPGGRGAGRSGTVGRCGSTAGGANGMSSTGSRGGVPSSFTVARPRYSSNYYYGYGGYGRGSSYGAPPPTSDETFRSSTQNRIPGYEVRSGRDAYPTLNSYDAKSSSVLKTYNR